MKRIKSGIYIVLTVAVMFTLSAAAYGAEPDTHFNDVTKNEWYYNDVYNVCEKGMFNGTSKNTFSPKQKMTRGMLLTVVYRMDGNKEVLNTGSVYENLSDELYYKKAMIYADKSGLLEGISDSYFEPETDISREELVTVLYNHYQTYEAEPELSSASLANFEDYAKVAEWAETPFKWAVGNGLINGRDGLYLAPQDSSTRAEVAAVLMRYKVKFKGDSTKVYLNTSYIDDSLNALSNTSNSYWFGTNADALNRPLEPQRVQNLYGEKYDFMSIGDSGAKTIYLTFDEGYENGYTPRILDVLKEKNVKAVFFVTLPFVQENPQLVQRMIDEGHIVGNHSSTHPSKGMPSLSLQAQVDDIQTLQNLMRYQYDYEMTLFRYPAGIYSERSLQLMKNMGLKSVFWSFAYYDYDVKSQPGLQSSLQKLNAKLHPGAVYLLHAVSSTNTAILGNFIDSARAAGYNFSLIYN